MAKIPNFKHTPDAFRLCPKCKLLWPAQPRTFGQHKARCIGYPKPGTGPWYIAQSRRRKWGLPDLQANAPRTDSYLQAAPPAAGQEFQKMDAVARRVTSSTQMSDSVRLCCPHCGHDILKILRIFAQLLADIPVRT